jgi:hypothetical protein
MGLIIWRALPVALNGWNWKWYESWDIFSQCCHKRYLRLCAPMKGEISRPYKRFTIRKLDVARLIQANSDYASLRNWLWMIAWPCVAISVRCGLPSCKKRPHGNGLQ